MSSLRTEQLAGRTLRQCAGDETGEPRMESHMSMAQVPRLSDAGFRRGSVSLETGMTDSRLPSKKGLQLDENSNYVIMHSAPATPTGCEHERCPMFIWRVNQKEAMEEIYQQIGTVLVLLGDEIQSAPLLRGLRAAPSKSELICNILIGRPTPLPSSQAMAILQAGCIATLVLRMCGGLF